MQDSTKTSHPLEELYEILGEDLENCTSDGLLISENEDPIPLTKDSFKEIKESGASRKIAFVDGGDGILEEAPNFLININRIYFSMFSGKKRISPSTIKSRIEFFSSVVTKILKEDSKITVTYKTKLFPYDDQDRKLLPDEIDLESTTEGATILEKGRINSLSRRFAEWSFAKKIVEEELGEGDIIVKDGALQTGFKNETRYAKELYDIAMKKGVIVCGLAKASRIIELDCAEPIIAKVQQFSKKLNLGKWYFEVGNLPGDDMGFNLITKFHQNSNHVFRFEILTEQYKKMTEAERNDVLESFANNSKDMAIIGYPYGFIDADRFAQVRKNELGMYKGLLISQMAKHPEWKKLRSHSSSTKFHDKLNRVTS